MVRTLLSRSDPMGGDEFCERRQTQNSILQEIIWCSIVIQCTKIEIRLKKNLKSHLEVENKSWSCFWGRWTWILNYISPFIFTCGYKYKSKQQCKWMIFCGIGETKRYGSFWKNQNLWMLCQRNIVYLLKFFWDLVTFVFRFDSKLLKAILKMKGKPILIFLSIPIVCGPRFGHGPAYFRVELFADLFFFLGGGRK